MDPDTRRAFLLWAKQPEFAARVEKTHALLAASLVPGHTYVAFSGGKDSTAMLHLVLQHLPNVLVVHWDYGPCYIPRDLEAEMISIAKRCGAKDSQIRVLTSQSYAKLGRRAVNVLGREYLGREVPRLAREGYTTSCIGLRAGESIKRRLRTKEGSRQSGCVKELYPIKDWSAKDVWAYILSQGIPYLSTYDIYGPVVGWDKVRMVTFFDPEFDHLGNRNLDGMLMWRFKNGGRDCFTKPFHGP